MNLSRATVRLLIENSIDFPHVTFTLTRIPFRFYFLRHDEIRGVGRELRRTISIIASHRFSNSRECLWEFHFYIFFWVLRAMWWRNKMWERNFSQANARPLLLLSCETFTLLEHTKSVCDELVKKYLRSSREPSRMKLQQSIRSISQEDFESTKISIVKLLLLDLVVVLLCLSSQPQKPSSLIIKISKIFCRAFSSELCRAAHNRAVVWTAFCSEARKTVKKHKNWKFPPSLTFS